MKKKKKIALLSMLMITTVFLTGCSQEEIVTESKKTKKVETLKIEQDTNNSSIIKATGSVNAETQVDVVALTRGTIRNIYFEVGDEVSVNKILASLYDGSTLTSLNNAQTNFINMESNKNAIDRVTNEVVRQAEIGVQSAQESIEAAKIGLTSAQNNLKNAKALREKNDLDSKKNAVVSFGGYLNIIFNTLEQVNYIIQADDSKIQIEGIARTISAKDKSALDKAKVHYRTIETKYLTLEAKNPTTTSIINDMNELANCIDEVKTLVDETITVLENTVSSTQFTDLTLSTQKSNFVSIRANIVNTQSAIKNTSHGLQNLDLVYNQEIDALESAVTAAENQLTKANTGYENALIALENTKQNKNQQTISSQSSLDSAKGQLNLVRSQAADLSIKAPIQGQITQKFVEIGAEVNAGQKIAQISKSDNIKIEINLPSEEIYRIEEGQSVKIQDELEGTITSIDPIADTNTKKVKVEILFDNNDKKLIPGTFVDVKIEAKKLDKTSDNSVYVPLRSVSINQNANTVFVIADGKAQIKEVETGNVEGAMIEITNGLEYGDELIIEGNKSLENEEEVVVEN